MADNSIRMRLLIDENVPRSVAEFFANRGHEVLFVRDLLPAGTADPVVAQIGDRLSAIVVTWDRDFDHLVKSIPDGSKTAFRKLGRISFKCREPEGVELLGRWIDLIEFHYARAIGQADFRMIVTVQKSSLKVT